MRSPPTRPSLFPETTPRTAHQTPQSGWITAYCDGGSRGNPGPSGYGAEITGPDGVVLGELSEFLGIRTNNYAEYSGLLASLQFALDHHHPRLRVVSDSELMVKQIQGKYKVNSPELKLLWQEARSRIARLEAFEISHALRHKNKAADALANQAMDRGMSRQPALPAPAAGSVRPAAGAVRPAAGSVRPAAGAVRPAAGAVRPAAAAVGAGMAAQGPAVLPKPNPYPTQSVPQPQAPAQPQLQAQPRVSAQPQASAQSQAPAQPQAPAQSRVPAQSQASPRPGFLDPGADPMLRGFTRDGVVHLLGGVTLPDGIFVKVIRE